IVDMTSLLRALRHNGIERLLTEGGPTLLSEIMGIGALDELCLTIAPVVGGGQRRVFENASPGQSMTLAHSVTHGDRIFCRYLCQ
ncbi:MAG: dihydrofolate reductase family protein, partial [Acidimicrobiia bacterium]